MFSVGYNVLQVNSPTQFVVNVGVSTVPTFYVSGGTAIGLSNGQYVSYSKGNSVGIITGFVDTKIYKVAGITTTGELTLNDLSGSAVTSQIPRQCRFAALPAATAQRTPSTSRERLTMEVIGPVSS